MNRYLFEWTQADGATLETTIPIDGKVFSANVIPVAGQAPADGYTMRLVDGDGMDLLHSAVVSAVLGTLSFRLEEGETGASDGGILTMQMSNYGSGNRAVKLELVYG